MTLFQHINPFIGTHSRRLSIETAEAVDVHLKNVIRRPKQSRSLIDMAFAYPNLGVGRRFQKLTWEERGTKENKRYWLVTRVVPKYLHPHRRHGSAWGILYWDGKLLHNGEERLIKGASTKKWRMLDENLIPVAGQKVPIKKPKLVGVVPVAQPKEEEL